MAFTVDAFEKPSTGYFIKIYFPMQFFFMVVLYYGIYYKATNFHVDQIISDLIGQIFLRINRLLIPVNV